MRLSLDQPSTYLQPSRRVVLESLRAFPEQCRRGYRDARRVRFPASYRRVEGILVCGMGGSALGIDIVRSVFADRLRRPLTMLGGYELPGWVGRRTLVLLSSYSGTTEEVLTCAVQARRRGARVTGITLGGPLGRALERRHEPWYRIDGQANPSGQPRLGLGYGALGQLGLLAGVGAIGVTSGEVTAAIRSVERFVERLGPSVPTPDNSAKRIARELNARLPILVAAEHLTGATHAFANQLNETAKTMAAWFPLPELNHHLLEGLRYPAAVRRAAFIVFPSAHYGDRNARRARITAAIVRRHRIPVLVQPIRGTDRLTEALELAVLGGFTSLFLSALNRVDPVDVPTVRELKDRLSR